MAGEEDSVAAFLAGTREGLNNCRDAQEAKTVLARATGVCVS